MNLTGEFLILGHRGDPRRLRENTLASVASALDAGADGVEIDVRRLRCGTVALYHDDSAAGVEVESLSFEELCRFEPDLTAIAGIIDLVLDRRAWLDIEIKRPGPEAQLLRSLPPLRTFVSSFDHRVLRNLRELSSSVPLGIIFDRDTKQSLEIARELDCAFLLPAVRCLGEVTKLCSTMAVIPWTANDPSSWKSAFDSGCAGVITDVPAEAAEWKRAALDATS